MKCLQAAFAALLAILAFLPGQAMAQLSVGARAPAFAAQGALDGRTLQVNLRSALRRGPVVLYFYPKAFTQGCTLETRAFADAHDDFVAAGASVIGMSTDDLPTLRRFSTEACGGKFAVAAASPEIIRAYDAALSRQGVPTGLANRISYVIARDGRIAFVHSDLDYRDHVRLTLDAVRSLRRRR